MDPIVPATAQPPSSMASPQQLNMQYAIAKALLGNQPQHMQSWLQPMAQMAQAAIAAKYMNSANAAQRANSTAGLPQPAATPAATGGLPMAQNNPIAALFAGGGSPGGIPTLPGAPY